VVERRQGKTAINSSPIDMDLFFLKMLSIVFARNISKNGKVNSRYLAVKTLVVDKTARVGNKKNKRKKILFLKLLRSKPMGIKMIIGPRY
jgi:hypothetical protein